MVEDTRLVTEGDAAPGDTMESCPQNGEEPDGSETQ